MKKTSLVLILLCSIVYLQAQLFEGGLKRKNKTKDTENTQSKTSEENSEAQEEPVAEDGKKKSLKDLIPTGTKVEIIKHFKYKCFELGGSMEIAETMQCLSNVVFITEMDYYEQGENIRYKEKYGTTTLMYDDLLSKKLIQIDIEDIEELNYVQQLQYSVLTQLGDPDMGYEIMKNYDGQENTVWADYSTYEYVYRYLTATNVYDFRITQFGAKAKNGRIVHPYTFSATVNPRTQVTKTEEGSKVENNFYPELGVKNIEGVNLEVQLLRKW